MARFLRTTDSTEPDKVLVTGGRNYDNASLVFEALNSIKPRPQLVICGGATGVDTIAAQWAEHYGVPLCIFPALWHSLGLAAGPRRNQWMLDFMKPSLLVVFPGGKGTADMVKRARDRGVETVFFGLDDGENGKT